MISVVLPAYNESRMLPVTVEQVHRFLSARNEEFEIIVVENGSTDDTSQVAQLLAKQYDHVVCFHQPRPDYGKALRKGFQESRGEIIVNFDVDFYDFDFLERAVTLIRATKHNRPSIVVGSKRAVGSRDERTVVRRFATFVFSLLLKIGFGLGVTDTHGVKALHRASVQPIEAQCLFGIDLFDTELILRCERAELVVIEIPVEVKESRPARSPLISRIPRTLKGLAAMRILFFKESIVRRKSHPHAKMQL